MARLLFYLLALSLLRYVQAYIAISGTKFFDQSTGAQFYIKGVVYSEGTGSQNAVLDILANPAQCALDAPAIQALGANTIRVPFVDPTASHDECMKTFLDKGIYVIINLAGSTSLKDQAWDKSFFDRYTSVIDAFAAYPNLLAVTVGNEVIGEGDPTGIATSLKAAARDVKAYTKARGYRKIPTGYATSDVAGIQTLLGEYLVCGGNSSNTIDFYGINLFSWCGDSSYTLSGYRNETADMEYLPVPIFLSEDGCNNPSPRTFQDQAAVFGPNMTDIWSGAIIYEWLNDGSNYGLVSYSAADLSGTPTTRADYANLQTQWATLSPQGVKSADYTFSGFTPGCPKTNSVWTVAPTASLPTIAGLNLATVIPTSSQASGFGSQTASGSSAASTSTGSAGSTAANKSGLSTGAAAGIGVGAAIIFIALLAILFFLYRRRKATQGRLSNGGFDDKAELSAGPAGPSTSGSVRPNHELPSGNGVPRTPPPGELGTTGTTRSEAYGTPRHELHGQTSSNAPWAHDGAGYMPAELHPTSIQEAGAGVSTRRSENSIDQPLLPAKDHDIDTSDPSTPTDKTGISSSRPKSTASNRPNPFPFDDSELAEDADVAVQELGLISVRKRTLVSQANTAGVKPEDVEGRKGEEYRELMGREQRVRARLDEIERQRRDYSGL